MDFCDSKSLGHVWLVPLAEKSVTSPVKPPAMTSSRTVNLLTAHVLTSNL
jgi:hypothetical protein